MLIVDERRATECLAGLKYLRRAEICDRERLQRQHRRQLQRPATERARPLAHHPVLRLPGREVAELALLIVETEERRAVFRPLPSRRWRCVARVLMVVLRQRWSAGQTHAHRAHHRNRAPTADAHVSG